jgi:hypothetical protein
MMVYYVLIDFSLFVVSSLVSFRVLLPGFLLDLSSGILPSSIVCWAFLRVVEIWVPWKVVPLCL